MENVSGVALGLVLPWSKYHEAYVAYIQSTARFNVRSNSQSGFVTGLTSAELRETATSRSPKSHVSSLPGTPIVIKKIR